MVHSFDQEDNLFNVGWLWLFVHDLEGCQSKCLNKKMLVDVGLGSLLLLRLIV